MHLRFLQPIRGANFLRHTKKLERWRDKHRASLSYSDRRLRNGWGVECGGRGKLLAYFGY